MTAKKTKSTNPVADSLVKRLEALEDAILVLCNRFERDTGMSVFRLVHPRDGDRGIGKTEALSEGARVRVGATAPFDIPYRP